MNMKQLTENKLRKIIREEVRDLREQSPEPGLPYDRFDRFFQKNGMQVGRGEYMYKDFFFHLDNMGSMATFVNVFRNKNDSESLVSAKVENGQVRIQQPSFIKGGRPKTANIKFRSAEQVVRALLERAREDMGTYGEYR